MMGLPVRPADMMDMAVVALLIYALLVWFKKTRTAFVVMGLLVLMAVWLAAGKGDSARD